jgi:Ca-activated chloride channel family protein
MLEFEQPWWLLLMALMPVLYWWHRRLGEKHEGIIRFSSLKLFQIASIQSSRRIARILHGVKYALISLVVIGLARPQLKDVIQETQIEVIDIVLVLDISSSMRAADLKPNRLEATKKAARRFIDDRPYDRIGLVVFAAQSFIHCPLTNDTDVLLSLLDQVAIVEKEFDGTAIGMAIANSINRLRDTPSKGKVMILLSDGSNNAGELDPTTAAMLAAEFGIRIYTIGAGSQGLAPYPVNDPIWGQRMAQVEVDLDEETLREVARITNGKYFRATDHESLGEIYSQINELERTVMVVSEYLNSVELYAWFVIPAGLLGLALPVASIGIFRRFII